MHRLLQLLGAVVVLGLSALLGTGAWSVIDQHRLLSDFAHWPRAPGVLKAMEIRPGTYRLHSVQNPSPDYEYTVDGRTYAGTTYELAPNHYHSLDEAKRDVETALLGGKAGTWTRAERRFGMVSALEVRDLPVTVVHSPKDPQLSALLPRPPSTGILDWFVSAVLVLLSLIFLLAAIALAFAPADVAQRHEVPAAAPRAPAPQTPAAPAQAPATAPPETLSDDPSARHPVCLCKHAMTAPDLLDIAYDIYESGPGLLHAGCPACKSAIDFKPYDNLIEVGYTYWAGSPHFEGVLPLPCRGLAVQREGRAIELRLGERRWRFTEPG